MALPAYGVDTETLVDAPQCSASGEFCFLCAFEPDAVAESDAYTSLVELISDLVDAKREIPAIVRTVSAAYERTVRRTISYTHPDTNEIVPAPEWSHSSIRRHLLFSEQFPGLFHGVVTCMLHSIIIRYNARMIDAETNEPIEEKRRAFIDTLGALQKWDAGAAKEFKRRRR